MTSGVQSVCEPVRGSHLCSHSESRLSGDRFFIRADDPGHPGGGVRGGRHDRVRRQTRPNAERAIARERARDSASALEAEGRLIGGSGGAIAPPVIAERAIARDLG